MRDIRQDLRERLQGVAEQRKAIAIQYESLTEQEKQLKALLDSEDKLWNGTSALTQAFLAHKERATAPKEVTLGSALRNILSDDNEHSLEDIKALLKDSPLLAKSNSPGRTIHFTLVGLTQHNMAERTASGKWRQPKKAKEFAAA